MQFLTPPLNLFQRIGVLTKFVICFFLYFVLLPTAASQETRDKLEGIDVEEVCQDRPGDEYFRLDTESDCREVYR